MKVGLLCFELFFALKKEIGGEGEVKTGSLATAAGAAKVKRENEQ